jgi:nucleotide-binding universal stress UspA family protein
MGNMFKKILVAVDASKNAQKAAEEAIALAGVNGAELTAISVVDLPDYAATIGEVDEAKLEGQKFYSKILTPIAAKASQQGIPVKTKILNGHPAETIIKYAQQEKYDLIIMGHQGVSAIKEFLMGSVSGKVLQHAGCSVLIIK